MSADTHRFAAKVLAAFEAAGRTTDHQVGLAGGPSTSTMTKLRNAARRQGELPEPRASMFLRIEAAANWEPGTAKRVWAGEEPGPGVARTEETRVFGNAEHGFVEFTVEGNFGVRAVVKGPIEDLDALQGAVSKLIAGMQTETSIERTHH